MHALSNKLLWEVSINFQDGSSTHKIPIFENPICVFKEMVYVYEEQVKLAK
jgi:hypothetical protein